MNIYRLLFLLVSVLSCISLSSTPLEGSYFPTGMRWKEVLSEEGHPLDTMQSHVYEIGNDTLLNGIIYKKVWMDGEEARVLVREENNQVWLLADDAPREMKLYDFNWDVDVPVFVEYLHIMEGNTETEGETDIVPVEISHDYTTTRISSFDYQYHKEDDAIVIRGIGRVCGLNRNASLLGYKITGEILPGVIYNKVLWIEKNGKRIFYSDQAKEWISSFPDAENIPFVQDGKRWKATYYWGALNDHLGVKHRYHYDFVLEGDTIIKGEACKKMYVDSSLDGSRKEYLLSMYQEGQKVYFVPKDSQEGLLLYDFGAEVGDIIEVFTGPSINPAQSSYQYSPVEMRVLDVEMRMYHGVERRCLYVINESDYQSYVDDDEPFTLEDLMPESGWWIEGLGKEGYPFDNTQVGMMMGGGMSTWLCTVGTDTLYTNGTFDPTANQCLVDGGMSWIQEYSPGNSVSPEYRKLEKRHFYFKLDEERVMIAGHRCRYLHASVLGEEKNEHIVAALYEEDGKVWFYPWKGSEDAYLLYDFHANEGDVLTVGVLDYWDDFQEERDVQQRKCKVEKVTEEEFKGIKRRCLYLNEACNEEGEFFTDRSDENSCWIEGIGSLLGIEGNLPGAWMAGTPHQKLLDCSWMDDVYYHDDETIFPDAIQDVHIDKRNQHAKEVYFDLTGRPVSTPSKGIYIHNGKKVLVR